MGVIGVTVMCAAIPSFAEEQAPENPQQIYIDQMAKYPTLSKQFSKEIAANAHPRPAPSEDENIFLWQLEDYTKLNKEFADTFAQNVATREMPETAEGIYLWQLEDYPKLDKTFYHEHRREF